MLDINQIVGTHDILFITLDTLRYDVAKDLLAQGRTPNLAAVLPKGNWEAVINQCYNPYHTGIYKSSAYYSCILYQ